MAKERKKGSRLAAALRDAMRCEPSSSRFAVGVLVADDRAACNQQAVRTARAEAGRSAGVADVEAASTPTQPAKRLDVHKSE